MVEKLENRKIKICFVSLNSYPLLTNKGWGYTGGAEIQQVELARELNKRGYEIFFITYAKDLNDIENIDGIKIVPVYNRSSADNLSLLRKMLWIWRRMKEADADLYIYHAGSSGITSIFGMLNQKKIIKSIASDAEVTGETIIKKDNVVWLLGKIGTWIDIKLSEEVISQNTFQKSKLKSRFKVDSPIIKNAFFIPPQCCINHKHNYVLWVGMIRSVKQPYLFLKIAKLFNRYKFIMIGGEGESPELFKKIKNDAKKIQNLDFIGHVPHEKIFDYYKKAILLINTSKIEGFSNVCLEAWMHSIPVVCLNVDPDGIITKYELGYYSKNYEQMINDIKVLLDDKELRQTMGENGRRYTEENHDIKSIANEYENLFNDLFQK